MRNMVRKGSSEPVSTSASPPWASCGFMVLMAWLGRPTLIPR